MPKMSRVSNSYQIGYELIFFHGDSHYMAYADICKIQYFTSIIVLLIKSVK